MLFMIECILIGANNDQTASYSSYLLILTNSTVQHETQSIIFYFQ